MITANQVLNFAQFNSIAFREIIDIFKQDKEDVLIDLIDDQNKEIHFLKKQLSLLKRRLN